MIVIIKALNFLSLKTVFDKVQKRNDICINVFCYENNLVNPVYVSNEKFEDCMYSLFITDENKSYYIYMKDFNRFMCNKTKSKNKKHFCKYCLQCFSSERMLAEHEETSFKVNGKQTVKLRSDSVTFKYHFKQLAVPFKIYVEFECNIKRVGGSDRNNPSKHSS